MASFRLDRSGMLARRIACSLAALLVVGLGLATAGAQAAVITSQAVATFTDSKAPYLGAFTKKSFAIYSDSFADSIGGIHAGVGAQASGSVSATLEGFVEAFWLPTYSYAYSSKNSVQLNWAGEKMSVGDSFFLQTSATPLGWGKVTLEDEGFKGGSGCARA